VTLEGLDGVPAPHVVAPQADTAEPAPMQMAQPGDPSGNRRERRRQKALQKSAGKKKYGNTLH